MRRQLKVTEREIQSDILRYFELDRRIAWAVRMNVGGMTTESPNGNQRFIKFGFKGCADILGQTSKAYDGRFLACECKSTTGKPTDDQKAFLSNVNNNGGIGFVARSVQEAQSELDSRIRAFQKVPRDAQKEFDELFQAAQQGDAGAASKLQAAAQLFLDLEREAFR